MTCIYVISLLSSFLWSLHLLNVRNQGGFFALQRRRVAVHEDDLVAAGPQQHGRDRDGQPLPQVQQEQEERARSDEGNDQNNQAEADEQHVSVTVECIKLLI